jgi:hypothetical protein
MSHDFERWDNNQSLRSTPPHVERILRADDRRRERRRQMLVIGLILIAAAVTLWFSLKF